MSELDYLREVFKRDEPKLKWWKRDTSKVDTDLYLNARMHDAEDKARDLEKRLAATESLAKKYIGMFDGNGDLVRQFIQELEQRISKS
jgi:hypothetical protein